MEKTSFSLVNQTGIGIVKAGCTVLCVDRLGRVVEPVEARVQLRTTEKRLVWGHLDANLITLTKYKRACARSALMLDRMG